LQDAKLKPKRNIYTAAIAVPQCTPRTLTKLRIFWKLITMQNMRALR